MTNNKYKNSIPIEQCSDPFWMSENEVNLAVAEFLNNNGVHINKIAIDSETGHDVSGEKEGYQFIVESKGSMKNNQIENVFGNRQIDPHIGSQVFYLMKQFEHVRKEVILILANPDIPRIRSKINVISPALDVLGFVKFWVKADKTIEIECPESMKPILQNLELMK